MGFWSLMNRPSWIYLGTGVSGAGVGPGVGAAKGLCDGLVARARGAYNWLQARTYAVGITGSYAATGWGVAAQIGVGFDSQADLFGTYSIMVGPASGSGRSGGAVLSEYNTPTHYNTRDFGRSDGATVAVPGGGAGLERVIGLTSTFPPSETWSGTDASFVFGAQTEGHSMYGWTDTGKILNVFDQLHAYCDAF